MARERHISGDFPLHVACEFHSGLDGSAVRRLVDVHPLALQARNRNGRTPVSLLLMSRGNLLARDSQWNALCVRMLQLYPEAARVLPQLRPYYPTVLGRACQVVRAENLVHLLIRAWEVAVGFAWKGLMSYKTLPFEDLRCHVSQQTRPSMFFPHHLVDRALIRLPLNLQRNVPTQTGEVTLPSTPSLKHLLGSATQRLLLALVELAWHETARADVVAAVRVPISPILRTHLPALDTVSDDDSGIAASIRCLGYPMELCREAFHLESVQQLLLSNAAVRDALCGLYRLFEWEDDETAGPSFADDRLGADPNAPAVVGGADVKLDPLRALELVHDNLDCLFLRLRKTPSLFRTTAHVSRRH